LVRFDSSPSTYVLYLCVLRLGLCFMKAVFNTCLATSLAGCTALHSETSSALEFPLLLELVSGAPFLLSTYRSDCRYDSALRSFDTECHNQTEMFFQTSTSDKRSCRIKSCTDVPNLEFGGGWGYNGTVKIDAAVQKASKEIVVNSKELNIKSAHLQTAGSQGVSWIPR
jgi:hypothetical protein